VSVPAGFSLAGRVAVVTGASRGIGQALAAGLAEAGATVVFSGREAATLDAAASGIARAETLLLDVSAAESIAPAFAGLAARHGRIDILVNNAGVEEICASLDATPALWDRIIGTNLRGAFFAAQAAARHMRAGGAILNLCSLTSEVGVPGAAAYGASKSGLLGLTRALAAEWAPRGIRVNGIGPGYFRTALTEPFYQDRDWQAAMLAKIPLGRFGRLEDLAGAAVFLCSDLAGYITGQVLYVDGGYLASI